MRPEAKRCTAQRRTGSFIKTRQAYPHLTREKSSTTRNRTRDPGVDNWAFCRSATVARCGVRCSMAASVYSLDRYLVVTGHAEHHLIPRAPQNDEVGRQSRDCRRCLGRDVTQFSLPHKTSDGRPHLLCAKTRYDTNVERKTELWHPQRKRCRHRQALKGHP